jgi:hypothetical protein
MTATQASVPFSGNCWLAIQKYDTEKKVVIRSTFLHVIDLQLLAQLICNNEDSQARLSDYNLGLFLHSSCY